MKKYTKGFTLIELLVVIAIIGILASVVLVSLSGARAKARDSQRIQGLTQMRNALELYRTANGFYPKGSSLADLTSTYISQKPLGQTYLSSSDGSEYILYNNNMENTVSNGAMKYVKSDGSYGSVTTPDAAHVAIV